MRLNKKHIPLLVLILFSLYPLAQRIAKPGSPEDLDRADSLLPAAPRDVLLVTADFSGRPEDVLSRTNLAIVSQIDGSLADMPGLRRSSSLLNAAVIRADQDEILVVPFIPDQLLKVYDAEAVQELRDRYKDSPEIWPYLSADFQSCVFYLEPGLTYSSHALIQQIEDLQSRIETQYDVPIEFTGLRAIRVYSERFLVQDIFKMLPIVFALISLLYFFFFRNWQVLLLAWFLKILATTFAYGCFLLFGGQLSPFIVLVPTFNFGLLSDYLLHMYYHLRGSGDPGSRVKVRRYLTIPLSLTALTSIIGFASLLLLGGEGHSLLAITISASILVVYTMTLWWLPSNSWLSIPKPSQKAIAAQSVLRRVHRGLTIVFLTVFRLRHGFLILSVATIVLGILAIPRLKVQPYPIEQLPASSTIIEAEGVLNEKFSGTIPFTLGIDSGQAGSFITRAGLLQLDEAQRFFGSNPDIGFQNSILTVLKRMHYYFNDADPLYLSIPEVEDEQQFSALVEQYLLFYSASASPESYESLIDSAHRVVSIQGILKYRGIISITDFEASLRQVKKELPSSWRIELSGPLNELLKRKQQLERNWFLAFAVGSVLIFLTVLIFFKNLKMSVISLLPSLFILFLVTAVSALLGIRINEYTIIIVAVSTGLTIDYTIHLLNSIRSLRGGFSAGRQPSNRRTDILRYGYSLIRSGGIPVFLSFLTSLIAFSALYLSSFTGAVQFGLLISIAIGSAFFIGVFLLPLFFIADRSISPRRLSR